MNFLFLLNNLSVYMAAINTCIICMSFFMYLPYRKKGIPYIKKCLTFVFVCIISSIVSFINLLLPEGNLLESMVAFNIFLSSLINVLLAQLSLCLTGNNSKWSLRLQRLFYIPVIISGYFAITNSTNNFVLTYVTKSMDLSSYAYTVVNSIYYTPIDITCFVIVLIGIFYPMYTANRTPYGSKRVITFLVIAVLLPTVFSSIEALLENVISYNYHFSNLLSWFYVTMICYIFFGYLRTARKKAIQATHEVYIVFNKWGDIIDVNDQGIEFFRANGLQTSPSLPQFLQMIGADYNTIIEDYEFFLETNGWARYYSASTFSLSDGISQYCGSGFIIREITEYKEKMRQLNVMATVDPLTGAKNRRYFYIYAENILKWASANNYPVTLLMLDLDHFKVINDEYGHTAGDEVLKRLCQLCRQNLRKTDVIFRFGGEEFIIMCVGIGEKEGQMLARRIIDAVNSHRFPIDKGIVSATVSIGGCTFVPQPNEKIDHWVQLADQYLYRAKQNGRNRHEYHHRIDPV